MPRPGPRQRLLAATRALSYRRGVTVGLDAILKEAEVARRSVYEHFGGKDNLIAEAIAEAAAADRAEIANRMNRAGDDSKQRLRAMLDFFVDRAEHEHFHGCQYLAADTGLPDPEHPVHRPTHDYFEYLHELLVTELTALGHPDVEGTADRLQLIINGTLAQGATRPGSDLAGAAHAVFEQALQT